MGGTRRSELASEGGRNRFFPGVVLEAWGFGAKINTADGVTLPTHQYIPRRPKAYQRQKPMGQGCRALSESTHSKPGRTRAALSTGQWTHPRNHHRCDWHLQLRFHHPEHLLC